METEKRFIKTKCLVCGKEIEVPDYKFFCNSKYKNDKKGFLEFYTCSEKCFAEIIKTLDNKE